MDACFFYRFPVKGNVHYTIKIVAMNIIFVCHGNICRSAMAEYIFKDMAAGLGRGADFEVSSAAVSYEEEGSPMYPSARRTLAAHGVPCGEHRAHRITQREFDAADLVVIMDSSNASILGRIIEGGDGAKVRKMMSFAGSSRDVADPWYTRDFETTYNDLAEGCSAILRQF